jgi:hypothetical protein
VTAERQPYDPLSRFSLGESVERALLESPCGPLPPQTRFKGAGIYAIYYHGDFELYERIVSEGCDVPIYVGKAMPPGARRGGVGLGADPGTALHDRLRQHARSIQQARNLELDDFSCRYLVTDDIWIPLGESIAIRKFQPLWNRGPVDGFGIHDPGGGRGDQQRSAWDVLHPGRPFAEDLPANRTPEQIAQAVREYLDGLLPPQEPTADEDEAPPVAEPDPDAQLHA